MAGPQMHGEKWKAPLRWRCGWADRAEVQGCPGWRVLKNCQLGQSRKGVRREYGKSRGGSGQTNRSLGETLAVAGGFLEVGCSSGNRAWNGESNGDYDSKIGSPSTMSAGQRLCTKPWCAVDC